jgi:flagellar protein FliS
MNSKLKSYENFSTLGLSQLDLILKVYDGAIASFIAARESYKSKDIQSGYEHLEKSKKFVTHLYTTLDPEKGGDIAAKLGKIYAYLLNQANLAQATKELKIIDDNINVLNNIREGWLMLKNQNTPGKPVKAENNKNELKKISTTA